MEIKEEMYARTLDGIVKIVELRNDGVMGRFRNEDGNIYFYNDMMCNPSFNIIDLIEVDDYVNGRLVTGFDYHKTPNKWGVLCDGDLGRPYILITGKDIKSIVTKEQFESMEYKL